MSKRSIIKSTLWLIIISVVAKCLSFLVRIMLARTLSNEAMNYYTLTSPTMVFVITLAQLGIPSALSKVAAQTKDARKPFVASIFISVFNNILIVIAYIILLPILTHYVLKQDTIKPVLYAIIPLIPCVSLSGLLKGYLYGIQKHIPASASQLFEEGSRILFLLIFFYTNPQMDAVTMAKIAMYSVCVGELCSSFYMLCSLHLKKRSFTSFTSLFHQLHRQQFDDVLAVSIPMTGSRLIGSLTYFLEPIVMIISLNTIQASSMINAYGQLNGYVLPIITMPSFLTVTLSNFLLPSFTYHYTRGNYAQAKKLFNLILGCCFMVGIGCSFLCYVYNEPLLMLFYHSTRGSLLLKQLAWPFALYALQPPLSSMLHALSQSKKALWDTFLGSLTRIICILTLSSILFENALPIALTAGMLITTIMHAIRLGIVFKHSF